MDQDEGRSSDFEEDSQLPRKRRASVDWHDYHRPLTEDLHLSTSNDESDNDARRDSEKVSCRTVIESDQKLLEATSVESNQEPLEETTAESDEGSLETKSGESSQEPPEETSAESDEEQLEAKSVENNQKSLEAGFVENDQEMLEAEEIRYQPIDEEYEQQQPVEGKQTDKLDKQSEAEEDDAATDNITTNISNSEMVLSDSANEGEHKSVEREGIEPQKPIEGEQTNESDDNRATDQENGASDYATFVKESHHESVEKEEYEHPPIKTKQFDKESIDEWHFEKQKLRQIEKRQARSEKISPKQSDSKLVEQKEKFTEHTYTELLDVKHQAHLVSPKAVLVQSSTSADLATSKLFKCEKCPERVMFFRWQELYEHYFVAHHKCRYCYKMEYSDQIELFNHVIEEHRTAQGKYLCRYCKIEFGDATDLAEHHWFHLPQRPYYCNGCQRHFYQQVLKHYHKEECLYRYKCKMLRQFKCRICWQTLNGFSLYYEHCIQMHKQYWCATCIDLRISFSTEEELSAHVEHHFMCGYCLDRIFVSKDLLDEHIEDDHPGPPFECPGCSESFGSLPNLGNHVQEHHDQLLKQFVFICRLCNCQFEDSRRFKDHKHEAEHEESMKAVAVSKFPG